jgi:hypothetical protein
VVGFDFAMVVLVVEFQVLELVDLVAFEVLDLVGEVLGFEFVVPGLEEEVLALVKEDPDFVSDPVIAWANLVARVDLDVARDVLELAKEGPAARVGLDFELGAPVAVVAFGYAFLVEVAEVLDVQMLDN